MGAKMILPLSKNLTSQYIKISFRKNNFTGRISILILVSQKKTISLDNFNTTLEYLLVENSPDMAAGDIDYGIAL